MSNFTCPCCGMINIDCGKKGFKTPKEIELEQECEELKEKYIKVLNLAKQNADSNEYCLQELEKENSRYIKALEEIAEVVNEYMNTLELYNRRLYKIYNIINKAKGEGNE